MTTLVTGGAGFIGANVAHRLLGGGETVRVFDNLSRAGVDKNLRWLEECHPRGFELVVADVRDREALRAAVEGVDHVFHFAAQVAVTTSLEDPRLDFAVNAEGTLNVLEAIRRQPHPPSLIYTSTNKVYGALEDVALALGGLRYSPVDPHLLAHGVAESRPLSFHSPYGCSKGTADQYVLDYAHSYGIRAAVFRMSCIYGPRQFGNEDQGWVAHFMIRALRGEPITIYGDGKQVRDILFVDDLVDAFVRARARIDDLRGRAFNVGGGSLSTMSLLELVDEIERRLRRRPRISFEPWRVADQRYYVSDPRALGEAIGWTSRVRPEEGITRLYDWLREQPENVVSAGRIAAAS
ncbi:MAG TPA: NAD-dependent epimerase/dehydratase family protein [Labilithrix sp.]|nr:NAD-dependent epimerase/dehydratase family protein [Labilithrix sp.]